MLNPELNSNKSLKEQVEINMEKSFSGATMMIVRKEFQKGNTCVILLLFFMRQKEHEIQDIEFNSLLYYGKLCLC